MFAGLLEGRRSVFQNQLDTSCDPGIGQFGAVMPKSIPAVTHPDARRLSD
jgi:hypothetical protein